MQVLRVLIALGITTMMWVLVTLLTKPEDMSVLKNFYRRALPFGAWGPVKSKLLEEDSDTPVMSTRRVMLSGISAVLVGAVWLDCVVMSLSALFVANYLKAGLLAAAAAVGILLFRWAYKWHIDYMLSVGQDKAAVMETVEAGK
jgi:hypothetical protein